MMSPTVTIKLRQSSQLSADYKAWLRKGNKPTILPSPGDGHRLEGNFSMRQNIHENTPKHKQGTFKLKGSTV